MSKKVRVVRLPIIVANDPPPLSPEMLWSNYLAAKDLRNTAANNLRTAYDGRNAAEQADAQASFDFLLALASGNQQAIQQAAGVKLGTTANLNTADMALALAKSNMVAAQTQVDAAYRALTQRR